MRAARALTIVPSSSQPLIYPRLLSRALAPRSYAVAAGPTITNSEIGFVGDDVMNIHSVFSLVLRATEFGCYVIDTGNALTGSFNGRRGDTLMFFNFSSATPLGSGLVAAVKAVDNATLFAEAVRFMAHLNHQCAKPSCLFDWNGVHAATHKVLHVELVPDGETVLKSHLQPYSLLQVVGRSADGAVVQGNHFHDVSSPFG